MKRERMIWLGAVLLSAVLLLGACGSKDEEAKEQARPVSVTEVEKGDIIQSEDVSATIEAKTVVDIQAKLTGRVEAVKVEEGQKVKKGQLLAQLETRELNIQLQQAQASLVSAKNIRIQTLSSIKQTEASYANSKASFERTEQLYKQNIISKQDFENAKLQYEIAKSNYETARQQMKVDPATGYKYVDATVKQAETSVALIQESLNNARILSPVSGIVTARYIDPGEMASGVAFTVVEADRLVASAKITEKNVNKIKVGQNVIVAITSLNNKKITCKISEIIPAADDSNTYTLKVNIPNKGNSIKPGMTAIIQANTDEVKDVMVLPRDAVVTRGTSGAVFVLNKNKVKETMVVTGASTDELVEIKKGLKVGDKVVTAGQHLLSDGDAVKVRGEGGVE